MNTTVGCTIFLYRNDKILIQKRSITKKRYPGYWEIPGGAMEDLETAEDTIRREMREELGIEISNLENLYTDIVYRDCKRDIVFIIKGQCDFDSICHDPSEVEEYCEITADDFKKYDFYPGVREQIGRYFGILR
ncbi:MAG: NUDIX domain-containing protein [Spirochaetales bacterium]|nr:NUDIX domain-containing protein [Spirochaetales bacterium]